MKKKTKKYIIGFLSGLTFGILFAPKNKHKVQSKKIKKNGELRPTHEPELDKEKIENIFGRVLIAIIGLALILFGGDIGIQAIGIVLLVCSFLPLGV